MASDLVQVVSTSGAPSRAIPRDSAGVVEGARGAPVQNIGNSVGRSEEISRSSERGLEKIRSINFERSRGFELRALLWRESSLPMLASCGRVEITVSGEVYPVPTGKSVFFSGLASCKSVWACPVCSPKIHARRRRDIGRLAESVLKQGSMAFGAYTLAHGRRDSLESLQQSLSDCWRAVSQEKSVRKLRAELDWIGVVLSREHTFTLQNGFHPHLHPLHCFDRKISAVEVAELQAVEFAVWARTAKKFGLRSPLEIGQKLHLVEVSERKPLKDVAEYLAKGNLNSRSVESVGYEMAPGTKKTYSRTSGSLTMFDVLEKASLSITAKEKSKWFGIYREYETATKGRSALTYSKGLRERFGLRELIKNEVDFSKGEDVSDFGIVITDWSPFKKNFRLQTGAIEALTPEGKWDELRKFLSDHEIDFVNLISSDRSLHIGRSTDQLVFDTAPLLLKPVPVKSDWEQVYL